MEFGDVTEELRRVSCLVGRGWFVGLADGEAYATAQYVISSSYCLHRDAWGGVIGWGDRGVRGVLRGWGDRLDVFKTV